MHLLALIACGLRSPATPSAERVAAVEACRAAAVADGANAISVGAACAPAYRHPACRAAFQNLASVPVEGRMASITLACRDAYCPTFAAPKPELCDLPEPDVAQIIRLWPLLHARILADELGLTGAEREAYLASVPPGELPPSRSPKRRRPSRPAP